MPKIRDYLYQDKTHRGETRFRFRWNRDSKRVTIKGQPGDPAFEREYRRLLALHKSGIDPSPKKRREEGTYRWLVQRYFSEMDTLVDQGLMAQATRKQRVNLLNHTLPRWGPGDILTIRPEHIREIMKGFRPTPDQANNLLKALRAMFAFAKEENIISDDPTKDVSRYKMPPGGFTAWTNDHLNAYLSAHPLGTTPHLAMMLLIGTACRRSDLFLLGPGHMIEQRGQRSLTFVQAKHGFAEESRVTVPIFRGLEEALAATQTGEEAFLITEQGRPFSKHGFGDRFRKWCDAAGLPKQLSAPGVRKAVGAQLADVGCTPHEIMAVHGHTDARTSEIYTKTANRRALAANAAAKASLDNLLGGNDEDE